MSHFQIFNQSIITFVKRCFYLGLSITSHVESFDRFGIVVFEKNNYVIEILNEKNQQEYLYI